MRLASQNEIAADMFDKAGHSLAKTQESLDDGALAMGFELSDVNVSVNVGIKRKTGVGRNVIARLPANKDKVSYPCVMLGAHIDHLGKGGGSNSLARDDERDSVHLGADDNASGVGVMLEIAQYLAAEKRAGRLKPKHDLLVAAWSGEELGLFGSQAFVREFHALNPEAPKAKKRIELGPACSDGTRSWSHDRCRAAYRSRRSLLESRYGWTTSRKTCDPGDRVFTDF